MQERNRTIQTILDRLNQSRNPLNTASTSDLSSSSDNPITLAMAVRMLQAHERARQGRAHAYLMHRTKRESKIEESHFTDEKQLNDSCLVIQTIWRQKHAEKLFHAKKIEESQLLGMVRTLIRQANWPVCPFVQILPTRQTSTAKTTDHDQHRLPLQQQYQEEFDGAAASVKEKIRQYESIDTKARMEQVLHQWLLESRQLYGHFPVYPSDDMRGSAVLFKEMTIGEVQEFVQKVGERSRNPWRWIFSSSKLKPWKRVNPSGKTRRNKWRNQRRKRSNR